MAITNATIAQQISDLIGYWDGFTLEYQNWLGGSIGGGPNLDGQYPLTDYQGTTSLVDSPAKLSDTVGNAVTGALAHKNDAETAKTAAETAETNAELAETNAETAETGAVTAKDAALAAQSAAESARSTAIAQAAVSTTNAAATAADAIATAADAVATAADRVQTGIDAAAAATFNPALYAELSTDNTFAMKAVFSADNTVIELTGNSAASIDFAGVNGPTGLRWRQPTMLTTEQIDLVYRTTPKKLAFERVSDGVDILTLNGVDLSAAFGGAVAAVGAVTGSNLNIANWDTAYGWGDHASGGYAANTNVANWDTAYGWGDHAAAGYSGGSHTHDGITDTNLLDKSAAETITGAWIHTGSLQMRTGSIFRNYSVDNTQFMSQWVSGNDLNSTGTNLTDWNISGFTAIKAGTVDADFDALTATSYDGVLAANLLDKAAVETITGAWTFNDDVTIVTGKSLVLANGWSISQNAGENSIRFAESLTGGIEMTLVGDGVSFANAYLEVGGKRVLTDTKDAAVGVLTATSFGGITSANLVDKSVSETISAAWTFAATTYFTVNGPRANNGVYYRSINNASTVNVNLIGLNAADDVKLGHAGYPIHAVEELIADKGFSVQGGVTDKGQVGQIAFIDINGGDARFGSYNWDTGTYQPVLLKGSTVDIEGPVTTDGTLHTGGDAYFDGDLIGHFTAVTGNYGSVQVTGAEGSSGSWIGYSINGQWVFMSSGGAAGIYDDVNNKWCVNYTANGAVDLRYNSAVKFSTVTDGAKTTGIQYATTKFMANDLGVPYYVTSGYIGGKITVSASAPSTPAKGDIWFDTT